MFSGLYGDLPQAKDEGDKPDGMPGAWSGQGLLKPPTKRPGFMPPPSVLRAGSGGRGKLKSSHGPPAEAAGPAQRGTDASAVPGRAAEQAAPGTSQVAAASAQTTALLSGFGPDVADEYDPGRPNDYEQICKQREQQRAEAAAEAERQERLREIRELENLERRQEEERARQAAAAGPGSGWGAGGAGDATSAAEARRAALQLSGEEAFMRRGGLAKPSSGGFGAEPGGLGTGLGAAQRGPSEESAQPKGMTLAQRMLEKMGWKEGEGLGRNLQGITAPLAVQKTDQRSGTIVAAQPARFAAAPEDTQSHTEQRRALPKDAGPPTRVILLRNMVGPGEVDEALDEEVGIECTKHGSVASVLIFEVTQPGFPPEEAVRIFVEFEAQSAAAAALSDLHGRFFGGRVVRGRFFDEKLFAANQLAPQPGEVPLG